MPRLGAFPQRSLPQAKTGAKQLLTLLFNRLADLGVTPCHPPMDWRAACHITGGLSESQVGALPNLEEVQDAGSLWFEYPG